MHQMSREHKYALDGNVELYVTIVQKDQNDRNFARSDCARSVTVVEQRGRCDTNVLRFAFR